jgi:hypothetical protein
MDIEVAPIANSSASAKPAIPLLGVSIFALPDAYQNGASTARFLSSMLQQSMGTGLYSSASPRRSGIKQPH